MAAKRSFKLAAAILRASGSVRNDVRLLAVVIVMYAMPYCVFWVVKAVAGRAVVSMSTAYVTVWVPVLIYGFYLFARWYRRHMLWHRTPLGVDESTRVIVFALPEDARELAEVRDEFFEPVVYLMPMASVADQESSAPRATKARRTIRLIIDSVIALLILGLIHAAVFGVTGRWVRMNYVTILCIVAVFRLVGMWVRPTYLRFVPGRVDVMRFGLFGRKPARTISIDLRGRRVRIAMWGVMFEDTLADGTAAWRSIEWSPRGMMASAFAGPEFARAALRSALSSHRPPPLPEHELVG